MIGQTKDSVMTVFLECIVNPIPIVGTISNEITQHYKALGKELSSKASRVKPWLYQHPNEGWASILNIPMFYKDCSSLDMQLLEQGLQFIVENYQEWGFEMMGFPYIECEKWNEMLQMIYMYLDPIELMVIVQVPEVIYAKKE